MACEIVGMVAMVIIAHSAAQTPKRSTTWDNPGYEPNDCPDGWFVRSLRLVIA
jgi:hypothetical protein